VDRRSAADGGRGAEGTQSRDWPDSIALYRLSTGSDDTGSGKALGRDLCGRDRRSLGIPALAAGDEALGIESGGDPVREIPGNPANLPAGQRALALGGLSSSCGGNYQGPFVPADLSESSGKSGYPERGQETGPSESCRQDSKNSFCGAQGPDKIRPGAGDSGARSLKNGKRSPLTITWRPDIRRLWRDPARGGERPRSGTVGPLTGYILNWIRVVGQAIGSSTHRDAGCDNHDKLNIPGGESLPNKCYGNASQGERRSFFSRRKLTIIMGCPLLH